jgi:uncharacterized protein YukE
MTRVAGSDEARAKIQWLEQQFSQGISDLRGKFGQANTVLEDPQHFDGPAAMQYKTQAVPEIQNLLNQWDQQVQKLSQDLNKIISNIMVAGGGH